MKTALVYSSKEMMNCENLMKKFEELGIAVIIATPEAKVYGVKPDYIFAIRSELTYAEFIGVSRYYKNDLIDVPTPAQCILQIKAELATADFAL